MRTRYPAAVIGAVLLVGILFPRIGSAYDFAPTDLEWATWPEFCRARYVTTNIGGTSKWAREYSQAAIEASRRQLGQDTFVYIHHYCAGIAYLNRSKLEGNAERRKMVLGTARNEASFTFERIPESSPLYAGVAIALGQIHKDLGKTDDAIAFIKQAIKVQPTNPRPYLGLALLYRDMRRLDLARDTLLSGDAAVEGQSIEIHYNLGLVYFELKEMDLAVEFAKKAYDKQYPLPGLQQKLTRAGRWPD